MVNLYGKAKHMNSWDISREDEEDKGDSKQQNLSVYCCPVFIIISFD